MVQGLLKVFANKEHMGFSNANDYPPSDSITLSADNLNRKPVTLKYVKFQNVHSLTIFIEDNQSGADITISSKDSPLWDNGRNHGHEGIEED